MDARGIPKENTQNTTLPKSRDTPKDNKRKTDNAPDS